MKIWRKLHETLITETTYNVRTRHKFTTKQTYEFVLHKANNVLTWKDMDKVILLTNYEYNWMYLSKQCFEK